MAFYASQGAVCNNTLFFLSPNSKDLSGQRDERISKIQEYDESHTSWKFILGIQKGIEEMFKTYPHINPHTDYSQNCYEILPNLQRSANPCLIQWLQTGEKEKSPKPYGSDIHFCLTNTTKTASPYLISQDTVGGFLLHVESHLWLLSAGGSTRP